MKMKLDQSLNKFEISSLNIARDRRGLAPIFIFVIIAFILAALAGGGVWYWYDKELKKQNQETEQTTLALKKKEEEKEKKKTEVPADFKRVTLNETDIFYPSSWGEYKKEISKENFSMQDNPFPTFHGEMATFGDYVETLEVMNADSYGKYEQAKKNVELIRKIYNEKKISSAEILASDNAGYLPIINAGVTAYGPKYIENNTSSWRGFWYLANIGQAYTARISFVSVMYNKNKNKVITIHANIKSTKSNELNKKIEKSLGNNIEAISQEIIAYMKTAYEKDEEVKSAVDDTMLKICNFVK